MGRKRIYADNAAKQADYRARAQQQQMRRKRQGDYSTPQDLFEAYDQIYHFTLDVCATAANAKCPHYFTPEQDGLQQPIGVVPDTTQPAGWYRLVFGLHRLQAIHLLERLEIAAYLLPPDLTEEEYLLIELQENSVRNDLTGAQRKAFAGEIGRLLAKLTEEGGIAGRNENWIFDIAKTSNVPQRTIYDWWNAFCQEQGWRLTPRQALAPQKERFFVWLETHQRQALAPEAAEALRQEIENLRRVIEAYPRTRQQEYYLCYALGIMLKMIDTLSRS